MKARSNHLAGKRRDAATEAQTGLVAGPNHPRPKVGPAGDPAARRVSDSRSVRLKSRLPRLLPGSERGATSGEFAFAILVLLAAVVVGGLGGVWIARREGLQKSKVTAPAQVSKPPSQQPAKQPENGKEANAPATFPAPKVSESKPETGKPEAKPTGPQLPSIEAITYTSQAGTTQIAIELGQSSLVRAARLTNPERVYFDLRISDGTQEAPGRLDALKALNVSDDALLGGIRVAKSRSGNIRVVLDLKRPCEYSYRLAPRPPTRLLVELKASPAGGAPPNTAATKRSN